MNGTSLLTTLKRADTSALQKIQLEKRLRHTEEIFLLFSMGSQFDHLIKNKLDMIGVYCLVADPATVTAQDVIKVAPIGIIISGGPASVHDNPPFDNDIFQLNIPILGVCLGFQMIAKYLGMTVTSAKKREFGISRLSYKGDPCILFTGIPEGSQVLETHSDLIVSNSLDPLIVLGSTTNAPIAAGCFNNLWGVQFHPEVTDTTYGTTLYENFCFNVCKATPCEDLIEQKTLTLNISEKKILLALSGGTDSSVLAYLLRDSGAVISGVYIKGLDRLEDETNVLKYFGTQSWIKLQIIDGTQPFLEALSGKHSMASKRIAMREVYRDILESAAIEFGADMIAQGTLYTDISESGSGYDVGARKAQIKLHHNVNLNFSIVELLPLSDLVKDTVRSLGRTLQVPEELLLRHPFPGPGLAVRVEGEVNAEKLRAARLADSIYIEELRAWNLYEAVWQAGAVVTSSTVTCTKGDDASLGYVIALWAVCSVNGFTATAAELPFEFLKHVTARLTNEIPEVGSVVYRLSDKPPATIEWG